MSHKILVRGVVLATTLGAGAMTAGGVALAASSATHHSHYYEKNTSFVQTKKYIEFTDKDYAGNHKDHAKHYAATDHFKCVFGKGAPTCDGQIARGNSMLIVHGKGGQGDFTIPITGGTGKFAGAHGELHVDDIGKTANANLTVTYKL